MSLAKFVGAVLIGLLVTSCTTPGRSYTDGNMLETLEIEILPNTSKMFVYRLRMPEDRVPGGVHIERGGFSRRGGDEEGGRGISIDHATQQHLHENAAYVVQHMGYCREGFLEIDSSASRFNLWVKGECKDGATEEDIKKFGTKQILPVKFSG